MKNPKSTALALGVLLAGCTGTGTTQQTIVPAYENVTTVRLTVAEGKRLIAKGLARNEAIRKCLDEGMLIITRGTTNTYIAEEIADLSAPHGSFVTGKIIPSGTKDFADTLERVTEMVLIKGEPVQMGYEEALARMTENDIVLKGANMLNYAKGQAAVCTGAPDGGTVARLKKYTDQGKGRWIVPIGLEKECSGDLNTYKEVVEKAQKKGPGTVRLTLTDGADLYTEIEALKEFADVDIYPSALGGVAGAEGGVALMICGSTAEVEKAVEAVQSVLGEPPFIK